MIRNVTQFGKENQKLVLQPKVVEDPRINATNVLLPSKHYPYSYRDMLLQEETLKCHGRFGKHENNVENVRMGSRNQNIRFYYQENGLEVVGECTHNQC